jgi:hypothetical protein
MRSDNRIPVAIGLLHVLWQQYPDLRFAQVMALVEHQVLNDNNGGYFYVEDDKVIESLETLVKQGETK